MEEPLLSVIVPIYNIDRYVGICIESIINQTYKNLEIVLVDDGSTDRSSDLCDLYAKKDQRIKVIHKANGGLVSARKAGLLASTGEYATYVDGDDWLGPGYYQAMMSSILFTDSDVVISGFSRDLFDQTVSILNTIPSGTYAGEELYDQMISFGEFFCHGITTYVWNKIFKRDLLLKHQMKVDERITIGEDAAVVYPLLLDARRISITDNCAYHYRQREDSMLKSKNDLNTEFRRLKVLYGYLSSSLPLEKYGLKQQLDDFLLSTYIIRSGGVFLDELDGLGKIKEKRVILFGAGTFGQQLKTNLLKHGVCDIVDWVDDDYWEYRRCCMDVNPISSIGEIDYDTILIAMLDARLIKRAIGKLKEYGVSENRITTFSVRDKEKALQKYLRLSD